MRWEDRPLTKTVAVGRHHGSQHRDFGNRAGCDGDGDFFPVLPVCIRNFVARSREAGEQVRRGEHFDAVLLGPHTRRLIIVTCGVGTTDQNTAVEEDNSFGVVESRHCGIGHDAHAGIDRLRGIVEYCVVIGITCKTESSISVLGSVDNHYEDLGSALPVLGRNQAPEKISKVARQVCRRDYIANAGTVFG